MLDRTQATTELVDAIASELCSGINYAVDYWMAEIEQAFADPKLTTLGKVRAVSDVLDRYKRLTGKTDLQSR